MNLVKTPLKDAFIIEPSIFSDKRGFFLETHNTKEWKKNGLDFTFVQDNHSYSEQNILRGLHFQFTKPQGKLVRVTNGEVFDVAVDLRRSSETFGKWYGVTLSAKNKKQFWIPPGFAHGFYVMSHNADFEYKCTDYYDKDDEGCILWNDKSINIKWPCENPILSEKDNNGQSFKSIFRKI